MENNENMVTTTETVEKTETTTQKAPKKEDKTYTRAEVKAIKKANWQSNFS